MFPLRCNLGPTSSKVRFRQFAGLENDAANLDDDITRMIVHRGRKPYLVDLRTIRERVVRISVGFYNQGIESTELILNV